MAAAASVAGGVSRWEAGSLVALYAVVLAVIWWRERQPPLVGEAAEIAERPDSSERAPGSNAVVLALLGIAIMASGGWLAVAGAERVVARLGIDDAAVGLTFVGLATVSELFALVWAAARRGIDELAVAGVLGSAIYNATATLGVAGLIAPIPSRGLSVAAWSAAALPIGLIAASRGGQLARPAGMTLLVAYAVFLGVVLL